MVKFSPILENSIPKYFFLFFFRKIKKGESMSKNGMLEQNHRFCVRAKPSFLSVLEQNHHFYLLSPHSLKEFRIQFWKISLLTKVRRKKCSSWVRRSRQWVVLGRETCAFLDWEGCHSSVSSHSGARISPPWRDKGGWGCLKEKEKQ